MSAITRNLAITGGKPVRFKPWPPWPGRHDRAIAAASSAIATGRWTVSGPAAGSPTLEREFAAAFARWNKTTHCVTADHGTSALTMALEALGVGAGDEVIVPVLTWVASATAVLRVNATPVFVDADPGTGCMSPSAVEAAITRRTAAIIAVHLHYLMADMDQLKTISGKHGVALVEDAAQAHGATWNGLRAGTIGDIGAFSMQQSKVLTAGEGGAVVTRDHNIYRLLQQLRADSSVYLDDGPPGVPCLTPAGDIMGTNYCLTELQAAILLDRLETLDAELDIRDRNARYLNDRLSAVPGLRALDVPTEQERLSVFEFAVAREPDSFAGRSTTVVCDAVGNELGARVYQTDLPLHRNIRYQPSSKAAWRATAENCNNAEFPGAEQVQENLLLIHHAPLLAGQDEMDDIVTAFAKVSEHAHELPLESGEPEERA